MRLPPLKLHLPRPFLLIALGSWLLLVALFESGALSSLENPYADLWYRLAGVRRTPSEVVLVTLDEATLAGREDEPLAFWSPHFARATEVLRAAGVRVVGIDFLFSTSPERWLARLGERFEGKRAGSGADLLTSARDFDQPFRVELASGQLILAGTQSSRETLLPVDEYLLALPDFDILSHVGSASLTPDEDGTLRRFYAAPPASAGLDAETPRLLSLPFLLALRATGQDPHAQRWTFGGHQFSANDTLPLAFAGPPGTLPTISMSMLLRDNPLARPEIQALRDKVAFIGATYGGVNDVHLTPYGRGAFKAPLMVGAELQGQAIDALLNGDFMRTPPRWLALGGMLLLCLGGATLWIKRPILNGSGFLIALMGAIAVLGWLAFINNSSFPVATWQSALLACFTGIYGWRFTHGEQERSRIRNMFSRYVEPQVVEALLSSEAPPRIGGQARNITILFSDIRNFTTTSEQLQPEEVVEMLNTYFDRACKIMNEYGGCIDKFIGDAIMVEFGTPLAQPDHASRALHAALRLRDTALDFKQWMRQRFPDRALPDFAVGIGVHTGTAVVGNIGSSTRMEYTAIGDSVNLASRLEGMTKTLGCVILASRDTIDASDGGFQLGQQSEVHVKGRAAPVEVFEVLGRKDQT